MRLSILAVALARDWDRFRALFHPTARPMLSGLNREGVGVVRSVTPDEYITRSQAVLVGGVLADLAVGDRLACG